MIDYSTDDSEVYTSEDYIDSESDTDEDDSIEVSSSQSDVNNTLDFSGFEGEICVDEK